ncbi:MAG: hypothetical protein U0T83_01840 [Bacteriovoracaceae bacterium]
MKLSLLLFFFSSVVLAIPLKTEVWFMSAKTYSQNELNETIKELFKIHHLGMVAESISDEEHKECKPMGDEFFHPQFGMHAHIISGKKFKMVDQELDKSNKVNQLSNTDVDLVKCDKNYYFDLYCGKAQKEKVKGPVNVEVWVDISSSLRAIDPGDNQGGCFRKSFVDRLQSRCNSSESIEVYAFDTSKKSIMDNNELCVARGLNDQNRMKEWIADSNAKLLIIITDTGELTRDFLDYIDSVGGKIRGEKPKLELFPDQLLTLVDEVAKQCKK